MKGMPESHNTEEQREEEMTKSTKMENNDMKEVKLRE
jgi:hypothetical protein